MKAIISGEDVTIQAEVHLPAGSPAHQLIIINSAPGVPKEFYFTFAQHLSTRGFTVITYDYPMVVRNNRKLNWQTEPEILGEIIFESVLQWCFRLYPKYTIHVIGHGIGANLIGFANSCDKIATIITVSSGSINTKIRLENGVFFHSAWNKFVRSLRYQLTGRTSLIPLNNLASLETIRAKQKTLRTSLIAMSAKKALRAYKFQNFSGRLLTLAPHDDLFPFKKKNEIIPALCTKAIQRTRHLFAEDTEENYIGFFGTFSPRSSTVLWDMIADWICDNTRFGDPPFGKFDDSEFPLVAIAITDIDPTPELLADYLSTMKKMFERGPVFLLIDLTHVHWADSRLPRSFNQWIHENAGLVKKNHRYTVYVAPNFFIRNFLTIFHALPFTRRIKPHQIFKTYHAGITWLRNMVVEYSINNRAH